MCVCVCVRAHVHTCRYVLLSAVTSSLLFHVNAEYTVQYVCQLDSKLLKHTPCTLYTAVVLCSLSGLLNLLQSTCVLCAG